MLSILAAGLSAACSGGPAAGWSGEQGGAGWSGEQGGSGTLPEGTLTFGVDSAVTTNAQWGDDDAQLSVSHVGNLRPGIAMSIAPAVDGIPCTRAGMSDADSTVLELTCSIRPGNGRRPPPKLVIQARSFTANLKELYADLPGGSFDVPVKECDAAPTPTSGIALPQLCRVDPGSTADVGNAYEGNYSGRYVAVPDTRQDVALVAGDGTFVAGSDGSGTAGKLVPTEGSWNVIDGYAFTTTNAVTVTYDAFRAGEAGGTYVPYKSNSLMSAYSVGNALAVTMASVAGTWSTEQDDDLSLSIVVVGDTGTITGHRAGFNPCNLSGTIRLWEPGSSKNLYQLTLTASSPPNTDPFYQCEIPSDAVLDGLAAVSFVNVGTQLNPVYGYALEYVVYQVDRVMLGGRLFKE